MEDYVSLAATNYRLRQVLQNIIKIADKVTQEYGPEKYSVTCSCGMCDMTRTVEEAKKEIGNDDTKGRG